VGESTGGQFEKVPRNPDFVVDPTPDGYGFVNLEKFKQGFANDVSDADAAFMRDSQGPINLQIFDQKVTQAAWKTKPSWFIVATQDVAIPPKLLRIQAERIGADTVEIEASHVPFLSKPKEVAAVIEKAALGASKADK
jgi:pimeloyl-ACP methyl ester carboxylesterase